MGPMGGVHFLSGLRSLDFLIFFSTSETKLLEQVGAAEDSLYSGQPECPPFALL